MRTATPTLGKPLAVYSDVAVCDARWPHEVTIVTDGTKAYAFGKVTDAGPVGRVKTTITATCKQPPGYDLNASPCDGTVTWDFAAEGCWTADPEAINTLTEFGEEMDRDE